MRLKLVGIPVTELRIIKLRKNKDVIKFLQKKKNDEKKSDLTISFKNRGGKG